VGLIPTFSRGASPHDDLAVLQSEFDVLRNAEGERLQRYRDYREENESSRDFDPGSDTGNDYGQRDRRDPKPPSRHNLRLPMGQAITVKHAYRVGGRLPDVVVDRREETPQERYRSDTMEKIVWGMMRESKGEQQLASGAWDASQLGSAAFCLWWDMKRQMPMFRSVDPANVIVVKGLDDPHDFERWYRFWQVPKATLWADYEKLSFRGVPVELKKVQTDIVTIVECETRDYCRRFTLEDGVGLYEREHNYGFVPAVVIPNIGPERRVWGWADYEFVRDLLQYLPRLVSREADIIRAVANGAYLDKGTGQDPAAVQNVLGKGGVLPSKRDGSLEPIDPPDVPAFADAHRETVLELVKMLSFTPDASWGKGDAGSGSDRGLQMQPQVELTALKQVNWSPGLSRLFGYALKMIDDKQTGTAVYRGAVKRGARRTNFSFSLAPNPLPGGEPARSEYEVPGAADRNKIAAYLGEEPEDEFVDVANTPGELFEGDYSVRFVWQNRIDPDDPAYAMSEVNKFAQGVQSLRTTLERLGVEAPEDEIKLIQQEADEMPWLRQGMIALVKAQLANAGQGDGGGRPVDPSSGVDPALAMMMGKDGSAMDADATASALPGAGGGAAPLYGGA
jgi:hypothetical protein